MKYVEQVKSIFLLFLVVLSLILTFLIWTYTPNYKIIEETEVGQISIGEAKNIKDVIKPYRLLIREDNRWTGTVASKTINDLMENLSKFQATNLKYLQSNVTDEKINNMLRLDERMTLFFPSEVPFDVFKSVLKFSQNKFPEETFDRLIIDWSKHNQNNTLQLYFVNVKNRTIYSTNVSISDDYFNSTFMKAAQKSIDFQEVERGDTLSLYVPQDSTKLVQYTYYVDEISPDTFRDTLFTDPNIVQKNSESVDSTKYTDGMALMTADTKSKLINYVYPASESITEIPAARLFHDSFEFINGHGGITGDYRYVDMDVSKHETEYQLYMEGFPVFSGITSTSIMTIWGENQIFRYKRPYYLLDMDISSEKKVLTLPSGPEMIELLKNSGEIRLSDIDEIMMGYYLTKIDNDLLYTLEPSWFAIRNGSWTRLTPELLGGAKYGLE